MTGGPWEPDGPAPRVVGDQPTPRWTPDRPLAERITRRGRFRAVDPRVPGSVWGVGRWLGVLLWAGILGGAYARAARQHRTGDQHRTCR